MTLAKLTSSIFKVLQVDAPDQAALYPYLLLAYNQVRKEAECKHDFQLGRSWGYLAVPVGGASWLTVKDAFSGGAPSGTDLKMKSIRHVKIYDSSTQVWGSIIVRNLETVLQAKQQASYISDRSGEQFGAFVSRGVITRHGNKLELSGATEAKVLQVYGDFWLADYTDVTSVVENPDWFVEHCHPYLFWSTLLAMNKIEQTFVMRAEGNLTEQSIRTAQEAAWDSVVLWDTYLNGSSGSDILG